MWNRNKQMRDEGSLRKAGACSRGIDKGREVQRGGLPGEQVLELCFRTGKEAGGGGGRKHIEGLEQVHTRGRVSGLHHSRSQLPVCLRRQDCSGTERWWVGQEKRGNNSRGREQGVVS